MQKIFTFIASVLISMVASAQTTINFAALTQEAVTLGDASLWTWGEKMTKPSLSYTGDNSAYQDITIGGIVFSTKRPASNDFYRLYDEGLYSNGTGILIKISGLVAGQEVIVNSAAKGDTKALTFSVTNGGEADASNGEAPDDKTFVDFKFKATAAEMVIKNGGNGFLLSSVTIGKAPAKTYIGKVVNEKTVWTLGAYEEATELTTEEGFLEQNGLYFRGNTGSHAVKTAADEMAITVQGEEYKLTNVINVPTNKDLSVSGVDAAAAVTSVNDRAVAFNAGVAGHFIAILRPSTATADRVVRLVFNGEDVFTKAATEWKTETKDVVAEDGSVTQKTSTAYDVIEYACSSDGTFFLGGSIGLRVAAIAFVPTADYNPEAITGVKADDATGINEHVTIVPAQKSKVYSISGQRVDANYRGLVIKNGKKYLNK